MIYIIVFILMCVAAWIAYDIHNQDLNNKK